MNTAWRKQQPASAEVMELYPIEVTRGTGSEIIRESGSVWRRRRERQWYYRASRIGPSGAFYAMGNQVDSRLDAMRMVQSALRMEP